MTVEAKITSNTAAKNGDVTCDGASVANHTCFNVGDKQIQGLMLKDAKAPVRFSGWAGGWRSNGLSQDRVWSLQERNGRTYAAADSSPVYGWPSV